MARPSYDPEHVNPHLSRDAAERLQVDLFETCQEALQLARDEKKIPSGLIQAVHAVLKDSSSLGVDMLTEQQKEQQETGVSNYVSPAWTSKLAEELGIDL